MWLTQSLRLLRHEIRRGELTIVCLAIVLAVSAVFSLTGFSSSIKQAIDSESSSFIAADNVLRSSRELPTDFIPTEYVDELKQAQQIEFNSMLFAGDNFQLGEVTAVSELYPLRGELLINDGGNNVTLMSGGDIPENAIWTERALLNILKLEVGDSVELGMANFVIAGIIESQPDASFSVFTSGPTVLMRVADVGKTEIIQPGSRIGYRYLFAGERDKLDALGEYIQPKLEEYHRWYDVKSEQSPLSRALNRAERFLSLASMLGIVLAAVAVSVASRRYSQRHQPMVAVFKAMGASKRYVTKLYLMHWGSLSILSIAIGLLVGFGIQAIGLAAMAEYIPTANYQFDSYPYIVAISTGLVCAVSFAISALKQLVDTSPMAVIRGFNLTEQKQKFFIHLPAFLSLAALLWVFSGNAKLTLTLMASATVVVIVLLAFGFLFVSASRNVGAKAGKSLHLATANLKRRAKQNSVQLVSFTIAIQLLLLIVVVRNDLINEWQAQLPEDTPNHFFVNINEQQVPKLNQFLQSQQIAATDIYPVVMGRLSAINDETLTRRVTKEAEDKSKPQEEEGREGIGRELSLTWRSTPEENNKLLAGEWWPNTDEAHRQVSVESEVAKRMKINLGDTLTFELGNQIINVTVTSLREVDWQTMKPNFFMILSPDVLSDFPATYISAANVPVDKKNAMQRFLAQESTISVIDVGAMIDNLRQVIGQVTLAIEFILILVVIAGALVLIAQVQASMEERERELAILRTLGAKGSLLRNSVLFEFIALGLIAGVMAAMTMEVAVAVLQNQLFDMSPSFHPMAWIVGPLAGATFVGVMGLLSCWRLLQMSSVTLIRRTL